MYIDETGRKKKKEVVILEFGKISDDDEFHEEEWTHNKNNESNDIMNEEVKENIFDYGNVIQEYDKISDEEEIKIKEIKVLAERQLNFTEF